MRAACTARSDRSRSCLGIVDDAAVTEPDRSRGPPREDGIVRDEHDRRARFPVERLQQIENPDSRGRVEIAGRLVGEEDARRVRKRARDGNALLLSARELHREVMPTLCKANPLEQLIGACACAFGAAKLQWNLDVLPGRERRYQLEALEHEADLLAAELGPRVLTHLGEIVAVEDH